MSFADLKKKRKASFDKLRSAAEKAKSNNNFDDDDRYWRPTRDKAGNGSAIIRFLPAPEGEDHPYIQYWDHGFQGPGGWYIEKCLTTLGKDDPCAEYNSKLWEDGEGSDQREQARKQERRLHFVSNIYVVSDPANPDNEGKVFLYEYGKKIFDKINDAMFPEFDDDVACNPFDLWEGANFRLRIRKVEGYVNYDKSTFDDVSALFDDDDKLEEVYKAEHSLEAEVAEDKFKTYDQLKARLDRALAINTATASTAEDEDETLIKEAPWEPPKEDEVTETTSSDSDEDDDSLEFFQKLAEG